MAKHDIPDVVPIAIVLALGGLVVTCDSGTTTDPCTHIDCSSRGFCVVEEGQPVCDCIAGFHDVGLTCVSDAPGCGDGVLGGTEECDDGNLVPSDGCEASCLFSCHTADECDDGDQCTQDSCQTVVGGRSCQNIVVVGTPCTDGNPCTRDEDDHCEQSESGGGRCVGGVNECTCDTAAECAGYEDGNFCNGSLTCIDRSCAVDPATVVTCDPGGDTACARNSCVPATGACEMTPRGDGLPCDDGSWCTLTDLCSSGSCTGSGSRCTLACQTCSESTFTCELSSGYCIIDDVCVAEGTMSPTNPCQGCQPSANVYGWSDLSSGTPCDDGTWCNGRETCGGGTCMPGSSPCPIGGCTAGCNEGSDSCTPASSSTECRASAGVCDRAETCDGSNLACPSDARTPSTTECRASAGTCDRAENCDGVNASCPANVFAPSSTVCRSAGAGFCDVPETCTGTSADCPADAFASSSTVCRPSSGACDAAENCSGSAASCPTDRFAPSSTVCRPSAGVCDQAENCTGTSATCPADAFAPASTACRAVADVCDQAENCTGASASCPSDTLQPNGTRCAFCMTCSSGSCSAPAALGTDPGNECSAITCTNYLYGWSGTACVRYSGSTTNNGTCNGAGACASITQSCSGAGTPVTNGSCNSSGCRDTSGTSVCRAGIPAPSFSGPCSYDGGPCYCDCEQHGCTPGHLCNEPDGRCLTGCV